MKKLYEQWPFNFGAIHEQDFQKAKVVIVPVPYAATVSFGGGTHWSRSAERRRVVKRIVLTHYGNGAFRCTCCDETIEEFLTIDHLNGKGKDDRLARCGREQNSHAFYLALISQSFPKGYSTRCLNCNLGRRGTPDGRCPHKLAVG